MFEHRYRRSALSRMIAWVANLISRELKSSGKRWSAGLTDGYALVSCGINALCLVYMLGWAFEQNLMFGISFMFASCVAVLRAYILNHPLVLILVGVSVTIGNMLLPQLRGEAWQALNEGQIAVAIVLVIAYLYFDQIRRGLARGQIDFDLSHARRRRRTARVPSSYRYSRQRRRARNRRRW